MAETKPTRAASLKTPVISADSHVLEPGDLWTNALGKRFGDKVPRVVQRFNGYDGTFFYLGRPGEAARIDELVNSTADDDRLRNLVCQDRGA